MTDPFVLPKDSLHEVILRTIEIDNLSNQIIRGAFDLNPKWSEDTYPVFLNHKELNRFNLYFLEGLGSSSRADLLLEILEDRIKENKKEIKHCDDFKNKMVNFYKIRNIFAHNYYPKDLKGVTRLESSTPHWIELNKQHKELFEELKNFLLQLV